MPYTEGVDHLSQSTKDFHRAIESLKEELEAIDWYNQRIDVCEDRELISILTHNRDEEKEHASMLIEWLRRNDVSFQKEFKQYMFSEGPIVSLEV